MPETRALTDLVPIPPDINVGLTPARQATMISLLGNPRSDYTDECQGVENQELKKLMVTRDLGPFRATGLAPAAESLAQVLGEIKVAVPHVHPALSTAGMLCARLVRDSATAISNHSWGTAIDLKLNGKLDRRGDRMVQFGLTLIAPIFNRHGWFWGAAFRTEDAMHFEAGDGMIRKWHAEGRFATAGGTSPALTAPVDDLLTQGDRGPEVAQLQTRLNAFGAGLKVDGDFGTGTRAAVMVFQRSKGLTADGVVGAATRKALGM
jgi:hypothetical protein